MMQFSTVGLCIFWLLAMAGPGALMEADAVSLRSRSPPKTRSEPAPVSDATSPADMEDEEDLLDSDQEPSTAAMRLPDQAVANMLPVAPPRSAAGLALALAPQRAVAAAPSLQAVATPVVATSAVAKAAVAAPAVATLAVPPPLPEAVFQFTPPRLSHHVPAAAIAALQAGAAGKATSWAMTNVSMQEGAPKIPWPPSDSQYKHCDPPCIQGRGICNDNVCFCRSPYAGSTCQHETVGLYRAPKIMVVGFAAVCFVLGIVISKLMFAFTERAVEARLEKYGSGKRRFELWHPPEDKKQKKAPPKKLDAGL